MKNGILFIALSFFASMALPSLAFAENETGDFNSSSDADYAAEMVSMFCNSSSETSMNPSGSDSDTSEQESESERSNKLLSENNSTSSQPFESEPRSPAGSSNVSSISTDAR